MSVNVKIGRWESECECKCKSVNMNARNESLSRVHCYSMTRVDQSRGEGEVRRGEEG